MRIWADGGFLLFLLNSLIAFKTTFSSVDLISQEKRLTKYLIDNYALIGRNGRPVISQSEVTRVQLGLELIQILDLDVKSEVITTRVWLKYKWNDTYLSWNKKDFGSIGAVQIPVEHIWAPDVVLLNSAEERPKGLGDLMASVKANGSVAMKSPAVFKSTCYTITTAFPFDQVKCSLQFRSWAYHGNALDLEFFDNQEDIGMTNYMTSNDEWEIIQHKAVKHLVIHGECCFDEPYPDLTFVLTLQRKGGFYCHVFLLPYFLLMLITLTMFILPPESSAKITLGAGVVGGYLLLLFLLHQATPLATHGIPLIGLCYCFQMMATTVSIFLCATVANLHFGAEKRQAAPAWLRKVLINAGACLLYVDKSPLNVHYRRPMMETLAAGATDEENSDLLKNERSTTPTPLVVRNNAVRLLSRSAVVEAEICEIRRTIQLYAKRAQQKERRILATAEWRVISRVVDRFFFLLYVVWIAVSLAGFPLYRSDKTVESD